MDGTRIRLHRMLSGLPSFSELVLRQLDPQIYAPAAAELERDVALPS